jgi:hypothetical protein
VALGVALMLLPGVGAGVAGVGLVVAVRIDVTVGVGVGVGRCRCYSWRRSEGRRPRWHLKSIYFVIGSEVDPTLDLLGSLPEGAHSTKE